MAILTLTFGTGAGLNPEIQVGDIAYYVATTTNGGFTTDGANSIVEIGNVLSTNFSTNVITINTDLADNTVTTSHFILFSKDNAANMSSILGYYAEVKMVNNSTSAAELFQISTDMFESSGHP
jgi:hypothetical protein